MQADSISLKSSRSSSLSLFPSTPPTPVNKLLQKPSPSSRSTNDPSHRPLPPKLTTPKSKSQDQDHVLIIMHQCEGISGSPTSHGRELSSKPSQRSANLTRATILGRTEYSGDSYPPIEADSSTSTRGAPRATFQRAFPSRKSSVRKVESPESPYSHYGEDKISATDQVSVARQISISHRQRQVLVPIALKTARQPIQS